MTDTPTNATEGVVLSEEHVRRMLGATAFIDPPDAAKDMRDLCRAYLTLTTERDHYRAALRKVARIEDGLDHGPAVAREALRGGGHE